MPKTTNWFAHVVQYVGYTLTTTYTQNMAKIFVAWTTRVGHNIAKFSDVWMNLVVVLSSSHEHVGKVRHEVVNIRFLCWHATQIKVRRQLSILARFQHGVNRGECIFNTGSALWMQKAHKTALNSTIFHDARISAFSSDLFASSSQRVFEAVLHYVVVTLEIHLSLDWSWRCNRPKY